MTTVSLEHYVATVRKSGLLSAEDLEQALSSFRSDILSASEVAANEHAPSALDTQAPHTPDGETTVDPPHSSSETSTPEAPVAEAGRPLPGSAATGSAATGPAETGPAEANTPQASLGSEPTASDSSSEQTADHRCEATPVETMSTQGVGVAPTDEAQAGEAQAGEAQAGGSGPKSVGTPGISGGEKLGQADSGGASAAQGGSGSAHSALSGSGTSGRGSTGSCEANAAEEKPTDKDVSALAKHLEEIGLLTQWQNKKLLEGRHRGFFLGKYKLLNHLGSGGMSSVYLAEHLRMKRLAAIKILPVNRLNDASYLERFLLEARAIASVDHPNIVRAYNVDNSDKVYYIVLEYVPGKDLDRMVRDQGPLPVRPAINYIRQAACGLAHAHHRGLIHRDIKPANLLVDNSGVVKLLDLGLARLSNLDRSLTQEFDEKILGTADYLAPEQAIDSHSVDPRADLYALGCTLYFVLTGQPPFPDGTLAQRLMKHQVEQPKPIEEFRKDVPREVLAICRRLMAKKREDRYQTAEEVVQACTDWLLETDPNLPDATGVSGATPPVSRGGTEGAEEFSGLLFLPEDQPNRLDRSPPAVRPSGSSISKRGGARPAKPVSQKHASTKPPNAQPAPVRERKSRHPRPSREEPGQEASGSQASGSQASGWAETKVGLPADDRPWWKRSRVLAGVGVLAAALLGLGLIVVSSSFSGGRGTKGDSQQETSQGQTSDLPGRRVFPFKGFPDENRYPLKFRPAYSGSFSLFLQVDQAAPSTRLKATLKLPDGDFPVDLNVKEASKKNPQEFYLGDYDLKKTDKHELLVEDLGTTFDVSRDVELSAWSIVGPFPLPSEGEFYRSFPPENEFTEKGTVSLKATYFVDRQPLSWKAVGAQAVSTEDKHALKLTDQFERKTNLVAYLYRELQAKKSGEVLVALNGDDFLQAWLNGQPILGRTRGQGITDRNTFEKSATLRQGTNHLLVKLGQVPGDWGLWFDLRKARANLRPVEFRLLVDPQRIPQDDSP